MRRPLPCEVQRLPMDTLSLVALAYVTKLMLRALHSHSLSNA